MIYCLRGCSQIQMGCIILISHWLLQLSIFYSSTLMDCLLCASCRYEGLSEKFLSSPVPKLLLLAGTDRLDRLCFWTCLNIICRRFSMASLYNHLHLNQRTQLNLWHWADFLDDVSEMHDCGSLLIILAALMYQSLYSMALNIWMPIFLVAFTFLALRSILCDGM